MKTNLAMKLTIAVFLFCVGIVEGQTIKVDYLYNSGWIMETASSFVLIDFVPNESETLTNEVKTKCKLLFKIQKPFTSL